MVFFVLQGIDILPAEHQEQLTGLKRCMTLEKEAINTANQALKNEWIRETKGLKELITQWRDDEKRHHQALRNSLRCPFFGLTR